MRALRRFSHTFRIPQKRQKPCGYRLMTVCVATICDNGKTLILVADKMIGIGYIESELNITKLRDLCKGWWILFAGDDITPVFDIIDKAKALVLTKRASARLASDAPTPVGIVSEAVKEAYEWKRMQHAEALYLTPIGWDIAAFSGGGHANLPDFGEIKAKIADYFLPIDLLIAGFGEGNAYVLSLSGQEGSIVKRHDVPGFYSIGSGSMGAVFMLYYREVSYKTPAREALYYAMEAKLFGEQASGVSESTDVYVATADGKFISLDEKKTVEKKLVRVWEKLKPRWLAKESVDILNDIPEMNEFDPIKEEEAIKKQKKNKSKETINGSEPPATNPAQ